MDTGSWKCGIEKLVYHSYINNINFDSARVLMNADIKKRFGRRGAKRLVGGFWKQKTSDQSLEKAKKAKRHDAEKEQPLVYALSLHDNYL